MANTLGMCQCASSRLYRNRLQVERPKPERRVQSLRLCEAAIDKDGGRVEGDDWAGMSDRNAFEPGADSLLIPHIC
jgi:hypothetical protein